MSLTLHATHCLAAAVLSSSSYPLTSAKIHKDITYSFKIITSALLRAQMGTDGRIACRPGQVLIFPIRNMLMCLRIAIFFRKPVVNHVYLYTLGKHPTNISEIFSIQKSDIIDQICRSKADAQPSVPRKDASAREIPMPYHALIGPVHPSNKEVIRLDVTMNEVFAVQVLDSVELRIPPKCELVPQDQLHQGLAETWSKCRLPFDKTMFSR